MYTFQEPTVFEIAVGLILGLLLGWVTGGIYNKINGKTWSGK